MTVRLDPADPATRLLAVADAAVAELRESTPDYSTVVAWLSSSTAALEHAVFPEARRRLPADDLRLGADGTRRLEHVLLQLHQAVSGDGRGAGLELVHVAARLQGVADTTLDRLRTLIGRLHDALSEECWSRLVARYEAALRTAPSRPHPHTPHGRLGERLAFPVAAAVDRVLDALDSRVPPALPSQRGVSAPYQPT
jgi:hypothetical protein